MTIETTNTMHGQAVVSPPDKMSVATATNELPSLSKRLIAGVIDLTLVLAVVASLQIVVLNYFATLWWTVDDTRSTWVAVLIFFLLNLYPLLVRGQTIGKIAMHLIIVDCAAGTQLPVLRLIAFRYFWIFALLVATSFLSPNERDPLIAAIVAIDYFWMLRDGNQRCLHDYLARSQVVCLKKVTFNHGSP